MKIDIRKVGVHSVTIEVKIDGTTIDMGMFGAGEVGGLQNELQEAADTLKDFINSEGL